MILPDEDIDSKTDRAEPTTSPRPPHHDSPAPVRSAPGTPEPPVPVPESTPEPEPEADSELLPPYTPRESDPLLPTSTRRRKLSLRARRVWICTLLLLLLGTIAGVLTYAAVRAPRHSSQVISKICQTDDRLLWINRTASDPRFYIEGGITLASTLSAVRVESASPQFFGQLEIVTQSAFNYKDIIVRVIAGHHNLDVLRRIVVCRRVFANSAALVSVELEPSQNGRVWLDVSVQIPSAVSLAGQPRLVPNLTVDVASMNVSGPGDLRRTVRFNELSLTTTNGSITLGPTRADVIVLSADGHPLTADLHGGTSVSLANTDGPITANVNLSIQREEHHVTPSRLNISSGGAVNASILLSNATASSPELVLVASSSAPALVDIRIASRSPRALLTGNISVPLGTALVALPPAFEGDFRLHAPGDVRLEKCADTTDPSGRGRRRAGWSHSTERGTIEGRAYWEDADSEQRQMGFVDVSGASASLLL